MFSLWQSKNWGSKGKREIFLDPENHYGLTKMMCEQLIKNYSQKVHSNILF